MLVFEEPHAGLQDSYRDLIREFLERGEPPVPFPLKFPNEDFAAFLARLAACARGEGLLVPHSTYWLVSDGAVVGVSNLRHKLTDALRREGGNIGYGVCPSARRQGFATELVRRTLERARDICSHRSEIRAVRPPHFFRGQARVGRFNRSGVSTSVTIGEGRRARRNDCRICYPGSSRG